MLKMLLRIISFYLKVYTTIQFKIFSVKCGEKISIRFKPVIIHAPLFSKNSRIIIGNNVHINSSLGANLIGQGIRTSWMIIGDGKIIIGDNVGMSNCAIVARSMVKIEDGACIGGGVCIYDNDFHSIYAEKRLNGNTDIISKPIIIGKESFIGAGSIILKGVKIGEKAVIGAGSVVTKNIPYGEIWAGNPAKFIRKIELGKD